MQNTADNTTLDLDVTVVIPAFEAVDFVSGAVGSALAQHPRPKRVLVVDDGSTDGTGDLVQRRFPGVDVVTLAHRGEAAARNAGLRAATTEWIAFLDADDRYLPGRLAATAELLRSRPELDAVTTDAFMEVQGEIRGLCYGPRFGFARQDQATEILRHNFVFGHVVARRERLLDLGGFDESISHTTDWALWANLLLDGGRIGFVDRPLSVYRVHAASASADRIRMIEGSLQTLRRASAHDGLTTKQHAVVAESIAENERALARARFDTGLHDGESNIRPLAVEIASEGAQRTSARLKGIAALVSPRVSGSVQRRLRRNKTVGTAGWLVPTDDVTDPNASNDDSPPLVSVILPFLNEDRFLEGAVDSVLAQSMASWELVLVDDGSSDGSEVRADKLAAENPDRISVRRHPQGRNEGLAASRNLGLTHARAETVAFLDADDRWEPHKLETQLCRLADHPTAGMVAGPTRHRFLDFERADEILPIGDLRPGLLPPGRFARLLVRERLSMPPPPSSVVYRTETLTNAGGVPAGNSTYEDQRTFVVTSLVAPTLITDDVVATYTRRGDSVYGRLRDDNLAKSRQRRSFEWWVIRTSAAWMPSEPRAATVLASLVGHRLWVAVGRRLAGAAAALRTSSEARGAS